MNLLPELKHQGVRNYLFLNESENSTEYWVISLATIKGEIHGRAETKEEGLWLRWSNLKVVTDDDALIVMLDKIDKEVNPT